MCLYLDTVTFTSHKGCQPMSDPITDAQAKINLAMALLQEAQQLKKHS